MPRERLRAHITWPNITKAVGFAIVVEELWQRMHGREVDQGLLLLAAGLLGVASWLRRNGNGNGNGKQ